MNELLTLAVLLGTITSLIIGYRAGYKAGLKNGADRINKILKVPPGVEISGISYRQKGTK